MTVTRRIVEFLQVSVDTVQWARDESGVDQVRMTGKGIAGRYHNILESVNQLDFTERNAGTSVDQLQNTQHIKHQVTILTHKIYSPAWGDDAVLHFIIYIEQTAFSFSGGFEKNSSYLNATCFQVCSWLMLIHQLCFNAVNVVSHIFLTKEMRLYLWSVFIFQYLALIFKDRCCKRVWADSYLNQYNIILSSLHK